ncbi:MAG: alpha/beta-type small acid-soluble spore protein [Acutalibacteraceae bacterium]
MSSSKINIPQAKEALNRLKMEAASEVGVTLKQGYNGDISARQAGQIGGNMVKRMIEEYENSHKA